MQLLKATALREQNLCICWRKNCSRSEYNRNSSCDRNLQPQQFKIACELRNQTQ